MIPDNERRILNLYGVILMFAGKKRYLMKAPLRLWADLGWKGTSFRTSTSGRHEKSSSKNLKNGLRRLEHEGLIRRFPGGIEIMENR